MISFVRASESKAIRGTAVLTLLVLLVFTGVSLSACASGSNSIAHNPSTVSSTKAKQPAKTTNKDYYAAGNSLYKKGYYLKAAKQFKNAAGYGRSEKKIVRCGNKLFSEGKYKSALTAFKLGATKAADSGIKKVSKAICDAPGCYKKKCDGARWCKLHKCKTEGCSNKRKSDSKYCKSHKCKLCNKKRFAESRYCKSHKCKDHYCTKQRKSGSKYCFSHSCMSCTRKATSTSNYCKSHKCKSCDRKRTEPDGRCLTHTYYWYNAKSRMDTYTTVIGPVANVYHAYSANGSPTFVDIGDSYPSSNSVSIVIWPDSYHNFYRMLSDVSYGNWYIKVTGTLRNYNGSPQFNSNDSMSWTWWRE